MLVCVSNKTDEQNNKDIGVIQSNFICDTNTGTVKEAKLSFGELGNMSVDQTYLGSISMFRTLDYTEGKPTKSKVYFLDNETD